MSMIGLVQSRCHEGTPVGKKKFKVRRICWKGRFWAWSERVKEWWMCCCIAIQVLFTITWH